MQFLSDGQLILTWKLEFVILGMQVMCMAIIHVCVLKINFHFLMGESAFACC